MEIVDENGNRQPQFTTQESKRVLAGVFAILFGALGIHKFILGYTKQGVIMLVLTIITFGILGSLMGLIGLIEGIIYLTKSDEEFVETYQNNYKAWF
ncbi:MAG: TM2 domain-containing protein [Urechidicola sp.]|nr:TM2 domain-containing protein [Urechidicola sp.]